MQYLIDYFVRGLREITDLLMLLNSAANFPICLYFSIEFRIKFREIFMGSTASNRAKSNSKLLTNNVSTLNKRKETIPILVEKEAPVEKKSDMTQI